MSRSDLQCQPSQMKLQMLQSNITRVLSQNKKLQHLLSYSDHFPRLRQHTSQVGLNRQRLSNLIGQINDLDLEMKTDRDAINININHYYDHINKNIINQIKNCKLTVSVYDDKVQEVRGRQRQMVKKTFEKIKLKYLQHAKAAETKMGESIVEAEGSFVDAFKSSIVPALVGKIESEFQFSELNCRCEIGHLQNMLSFYSKHEHDIQVEMGGEENFEQAMALLRRRGEEVARRSTDKMEHAIRQIQLKLKGVNAEIVWLQSKRRRQKRMNTKQSEQPNEECGQNPKLVELGYEVEGLQYQVMGLGRYCDKLALRKKVLSNRACTKQQKQGAISQVQQKRILSINQKIVQLQGRLKEYDNLYRSLS